MTEAEYEKLVEAAAREYKEEEYSAHWRSPDYYSHVITDFEAGIKWARENPGPEVQALVEALEEYAELEKIWPLNGDPVWAQEALARLKERTAGKGEG